MILLVKDYPSIDHDKDLDNYAKTNHIPFYYEKVCLFSDDDYEPLHKQIAIDAKKILKILEENYAEYLIWFY